MIIPVVAGLALVGVAVALRSKGGPRVEHKADAGGVVQADPVRLAEQSGYSLDEYALASMMVSEAGTRKSRQAVGWAARNAATKGGVSISSKLLKGRTKSGLPSSSEGKFGAQNTGKYASTRSAPTKETLADARDILAGKGSDPTKGSTQWDAPAAQNIMTAVGTPGYSKNADQVAESRLKTSTLVMVDGVGNIRFWKPKA